MMARMCNLYANTTTQEAMRQLFNVRPTDDRLGNFAPLAAIYPRYDAPVVRVGNDGARELTAMHWGFVLPQVSKRTGKPIQPKAVNNARDDKLASSRFWRASFEERRCLIPATAFCEPKGHQPATYYWFALKGDEARPPFAFAGIWRSWSGEYRGAQIELETFSMVTTTPNALVSPIHPMRMPVIVPPAHHETWLTGSVSEAQDCLVAYPAEGMRIVRQGTDEKQDPPPDIG
jgi:putative SOS response-associated peptidase YedK